MKNLSSYKGLGVINRTPNSFSDYGLSLNKAHFEVQLKSLLDDPKMIIDIGFESTAPMNAPISKEEEWQRFESFLEASRDFNFDDRLVSFDTYKPQNFLLMTEAFRKLHPKTHFIFNDVSGVLDDELKEVLLKFKGENFYYIYTFAHIPERSHVLEHMKYLNEKEDVIFQCVASFKAAHTWFKALGMEEQLILDPGFGFSKTYAQNWTLIHECERFNEELSRPGLLNPLVIGLSKKSFLKKKLAEMGVVEAQDSLEKLHSDSLQMMSKVLKSKLLFRVHDPKVLDFYL